MTTSTPATTTQVATFSTAWIPGRRRSRRWRYHVLAASTKKNTSITIEVALMVPGDVAPAHAPETPPPEDGARRRRAAERPMLSPSPRRQRQRRSAARRCSASSTDAGRLQGLERIRDGVVRAVRATCERAATRNNTMNVT
jgi:hypothetical protein